MSDYYIRTPDNEASRGPFDVAKLQTLAEAGQVTENTLFYDESREEWIPIALNEDLKKQVFPPKERLSLKVGNVDRERHTDDERENNPNQRGLDVEDMLAAAEGETKDTKHLKKRARSFNKAASVACSGLALIFVLCAFTLIFPHYSIVSDLLREESYSQLLNYPFLIFGFFDLLLAIFLVLAMTETFPVLRGRAMINLGFMGYVGWVIQDPILIAAGTIGGLGIFAATIAKTYPSMLVSLACGIAGNGYLAYLALSGRFSGFFDAAQIPFFTGS